MRWDILNYLVDKNKYKSYLEIGVQDYNSNCGKVIAEHKVAVDPFPRGKCDFVGTSDSYFNYISDDVKFDLIFIDGLHHSDQVVKDIDNSLNHLNEGGTIVVHDCLPENFSNQVKIDHGGEWTGDVWKVGLELMETNNVDFFVVKADHGIGVVQKKGLVQLNNKIDHLKDLRFKDFLPLSNKINYLSAEDSISVLK
jgi:hypothetical protein